MECKIIIEYKLCLNHNSSSSPILADTQFPYMKLMTVGALKEILSDTHSCTTMTCNLELLIHFPDMLNLCAYFAVSGWLPVHLSARSVALVFLHAICDHHYHGFSHSALSLPGFRIKSALQKSTWGAWWTLS